MSVNSVNSVNLINSVNSVKRLNSVNHINLKSEYSKDRILTIQTSFIYFSGILKVKMIQIECGGEAVSGRALHEPSLAHFIPESLGLNPCRLVCGLCGVNGTIYKSDNCLMFPCVIGYP